MNAQTNLNTRSVSDIMDIITMDINSVNEVENMVDERERDYREFFDTARSTDGEEPELQYYSMERMTALATRFGFIRYFIENGEIQALLLNEWRVIHADFLRESNDDQAVDGDEDTEPRPEWDEVPNTDIAQREPQK